MSGRVTVFDAMECLEQLEAVSPGFARRLLAAIIANEASFFRVSPDEGVALATSGLWEVLAAHKLGLRLFVRGGPAGEDEVSERLKTWLAEGAP